MAQEMKRDVIERMLPELVAEGYEVFVHPNTLVTPVFFGDYRPDILARRPDRNIAIDIKRRGTDETPNLEVAAKRLQGQKGWEFQIVWIEPTEAIETLPAQSNGVIERRLAEVKAVAASEHREIALLMAWSIVEAAARALAPTETERPQTTARTLQLLASEGYVTPNEADRLRVLATKRDRLTHGGLHEQVSQEELADMLATIDELMSQLPASAPQPA